MPAETEATVDRRLDELETRYMQQQQMLEQLSGVLYEQQQTIDLLAREVRSLRERLHAGASSPIDGGEEGPPPHY